MEYNELRKQYQTFYYHDYQIDEDDLSFKVTYHFEIEGLSTFAPTFTIPKKEQTTFSQYQLVKNAAFHLGMVELISYWKIACPKKVIVECSTLDEYQVKWWKKLYFHGLGEFFYKNGIEPDMDTFMDLTSSGNVIEGNEYNGTYHGNLIPVGGGKDSFVTLHLLEKEKEQNTAFIINPIISAVNAAHAAGYQENENLVQTRRTLDQNMLDLNKQGYLNGHTPFSAMAAFASYLTAMIYHKKYIVLSNEASANESTIKGSTVNHQYSKSFAFEKDFKEYVDKYLTNEIHYFSLLRPLSELQIARIFSTEKPYLSVFRSCNVGQKKGVWCGECAKCLFVCIMMSAFLPQNEVINIFHKDMLNDANMRVLFEQLTGILDDKPFECVGTRDEVNIAICMAISTMEQEQKEIPLLMKEYQQSKYYQYYKDKKIDMLEYQEENLLPESFANIVKEELRLLA